MKYDSPFLKVVKRAILFMAALFWLAPSQEASAEDYRSYEVRAAMIFNFARFTRWPEHAFTASTEPITICVSGGNNLYTALRNIESKKIRGRKILIRNALYSNFEVGSCHIIVLTEEMTPQDAELQFVNVLIISTASGAGSKIASIELVNIGRQTRFIVNPAAAKASGVEISSKLIDLAVRVR